MSWNDRLLDFDALALREREGTPGSLEERIDALFAQQIETWPQLREAIAALDQIVVRDLSVGGSRVSLQFNPRRMTSTAAKVDADSIKARPCFLCETNLPPEEKGIAWGMRLIILCNPFPILPAHLVIASREHLPQRIHGHWRELLELARGLGERFFVIYNGPACGASAPDHLHLQAGTRSALPILSEIETWPRQWLSSPARLELFTLGDYRVNCLIAKSAELELLAEWGESAVEKLKDAVASEQQEEPMLNLIATREAGHWQLIMFPRSRHRPSCYGQGEEEQFLISPAAIDLGGVVITPRRSDFERLNADALAAIFREVSLDRKRFGSLIEALDS
jgi:ATP adenylyltransferase/5',5'''-P-1,P-4-tetraphosphate phosphorylase II